MLSRVQMAPYFSQTSRNRWLIHLLCMVAVLLVACGSTAETADNPDLQITLLPVAAGEARDILRVQLRNAAQEPLTDATVTLEGNMNHAGMAPVITAAVTDAADGAGDGVYTTPFPLSMLGDWVITVTVIRADGSETTKDIHVTVTDAGIQIHDAATSGVEQRETQGVGQIMVLSTD